VEDLADVPRDHRRGVHPCDLSISAGRETTLIESLPTLGTSKGATPPWYGTVREFGGVCGAVLPCLELGPAEGLMTASLAEVFPDLTIVEALNLCAELSRRIQHANVVCSLFEESARVASST